MVWSIIAGPNPLFGGLKSTRSIFGESDHMWVEGEGMLHALYLKKNGRIRGSWNILYKNKHVQTDTYKMEKDRKKPGFLPAIEGDSPAVLLAYLLNVVCTSNTPAKNLRILSLGQLGTIL